VFFGSGVNNFGVMEVLDALVDLAPRPARAPARWSSTSSRWNARCCPTTTLSGVVFKVQANMDANHRDRIAFVRVASGKYTPGMKLKVQRTGKELRPTSVVTFMSQRREAVEEAYAGDIIGFTTHGGVQLGDTITDGASLQFTGLPFFAPELFMTVILKNPLRTKQLQQGWRSWARKARSRCSAPSRRPMLLGAVGQLQFEVVQHRLKGEYDADVRLEGCQYTGARWITADTPAELREFTNAYPHAHGAGRANTLAYLCTSPYDVRIGAGALPERSISTRCASTPGWRWARGHRGGAFPMFAYLPHAAGVANVAAFAGRMLHLPTYVAPSRGGAGFAEVAQALLTARQH
jgi:peptide chain release factor 3